MPTFIDPTIKFVVDPIAEFPAVEKVVYMLAKRFSETYPITFEECVSEGFAAYLRACQDYKPKRGQKFSSWVYYWVWCKLKDLVMHRSKEPLEFVEIEEELCGMAPPAEIESLDVVRGLSSDAQLIVQMLLETPRELVGVAITPGRFLNRVKDHVVMKKGRDRKQVEKAVQELTVALRAAWSAKEVGI